MLTRVIESLTGVVDSILIVVNPEDEHTLGLIANQPVDNTEIDIILQNEPLGTGDALLKAWPSVEGTCIVSACDSLLPPEFMRDFVRCFEVTKPDALIAVGTVEGNAGPPGSSIQIDRENLILRFIEKPDPAALLSDKMALPLYAFRASFRSALYGIETSERGEYELAEAIQNLIDRGGEVLGFPATGRITVNTPYEYLETVQKMLSDLEEVYLEPGVQIAPSAELHPPVYVEQSAVIESGARIGPFVYIMSGCVIGKNAQVRDTIVFRDYKIPEGRALRKKIVLPSEVIDPQRSHNSRDRAHRL
jgi:glucose-1-phosphate thymidylyltransferase